MLRVDAPVSGLFYYASLFIIDGIVTEEAYCGSGDGNHREGENRCWGRGMER